MADFRLFSCSSSPYSSCTPIFCRTQKLVLYSVQLYCSTCLWDHNSNAVIPKRQIICVLIFTFFNSQYIYTKSFYTESQLNHFSYFIFLLFVLHPFPYLRSPNQVLFPKFYNLLFSSLCLLFLTSWFYCVTSLSNICSSSYLSVSFLVHVLITTFSSVSLHFLFICLCLDFLILSPICHTFPFAIIASYNYLNPSLFLLSISTFSVITSHQGCSTEMVKCSLYTDSTVCCLGDLSTPRPQAHRYLGNDGFRQVRSVLRQRRSVPHSGTNVPRRYLLQQEPGRGLRRLGS